MEERYQIKEVTSGFLIVKTFERMYREYLKNFEEWWQLKHPNAEPKLVEQMPGKYHGIHRDPLQHWIEELRGVFDEPTEQELAASLFMEELGEEKEDGDFIFNLEDAIDVMKKIQPPVEREIIWARRMDKNDNPPPETEVLGYEPTDFYGDRDSALAYNAFFVHCWTEEGEYRLRQLDEYHARLNKWGLFDNLADAQEYLHLIFKLFPKVCPGCDGVEYMAEIRTVRI